MERIQSLRHLIPKSTKLAFEQSGASIRAFWVVYYRTPLLIEKGQGQWLFDNHGRKYLDIRVVCAVEAQIKKLWHTTSIYLTKPVFEYAELLTSTLPSHLNVCFFTNSGSEANDLAIELARLHTGRFDVLSLRNGYHGLTQALAGATNLGNWKQPLPQGFGILKALCPDPYRGIFTGANCRDSLSQPFNRKCDCVKGYCKASDQYVDQFNEVLRYDFPKSSGPAAFLAESIQGVGGVVQYPKGFLKRSFESVQSTGGLCISDEVQTGFGRLGSSFWGFESQNANPDIVTMAKVTTKEIAESFGKALYFNTFGGNPLASKAAKATLKVEEKLQENAENVGNHLIDELSKLSGKWIGDIRGKGLMLGVELINENGDPLEVNRVADVFEKIKDFGVLVGKGGLNGNVLRLKPPMCITKQDADQCVDAISKAVNEVLN
ncbi:Aminotransferase, class III [Aphelenchoides besseyi]|nr:Aminotransferase, class III [Aphelenchoides besseyi]